MKNDHNYGFLKPEDYDQSKFSLKKLWNKFIFVGTDSTALPVFVTSTSSSAGVIEIHWNHQQEPNQFLTKRFLERQ